MTERKYPIIIHPLSFSRNSTMKPITTGVIIFIGSAISAILLYFFAKSWHYVDYCKNCGLGMCINCDLIDTPYSFDYEIFLG